MHDSSITIERESANNEDRNKKADVHLTCPSDPGRNPVNQVFGESGVQGLMPISFTLFSDLYLE
jgi:hypothetical protein